MKNKKIIFLAFVLVFAGLVIFLNVASKNKYLNNKVSFSNFFQVAGNVTSSANRAIGAILPIDSMDEKEFGEKYREYYKNLNSSSLEKDAKYLNSLLKSLNWSKRKDFAYEIFVIDSYGANAFALPGGIIVVTKPLLDVVKSEGELVAVISHEIGHIENSHCFNLVKFELLARKVKLDNVGKLVDATQNILLRHSYSKTQEVEADDYAFEMIVNSPYDVMSVSNSFKSLVENEGRSAHSHGNILKDYFQTHPSLDQRIDKFAAKAAAWKKLHPNETRYVGKKNIDEKIPFAEKDFGLEEWVSSYIATIKFEPPLIEIDKDFIQLPEQHQ